MAPKKPKSSATKHTDMFHSIHNVRAFLKKTTESQDCDPMIDFLAKSKLFHALDINPKISVSNIQQFWATAELVTEKNNNNNNNDNSEFIKARVSDQKFILTKDMIRKCLKFDDENGVKCFARSVYMPTFLRMNYQGDENSSTIKKSAVGLNWRFLLHTYLFGMSPKHGSWDQLSSVQASGIHGLVTGDNYSYTDMVFDSLKSNILKRGTPEFFYMYPRFLQYIFDCEIDNLRYGLQFRELSHLNSKVFKALVKNSNYEVEMKPIFPYMQAIANKAIIKERQTESVPNLEVSHARPTARGDTGVKHTRVKTTSKSITTRSSKRKSSELKSLPNRSLKQKVAKSLPSKQPKTKPQSSPLITSQQDEENIERNPSILVSDSLPKSVGNMPEMPTFPCSTPDQDDYSTSEALMIMAGQKSFQCPTSQPPLGLKDSCNVIETPISATVPELTNEGNKNPRRQETMGGKLVRSKSCDLSLFKNTADKHVENRTTPELMAICTTNSSSISVLQKQMKLVFQTLNLQHPASSPEAHITTETPKSAEPTPDFVEQMADVQPTPVILSTKLDQNDATKKGAKKKLAEVWEGSSSQGLNLRKTMLESLIAGGVEVEMVEKFVGMCDLLVKDLDK